MWARVGGMFCVQTWGFEPVLRLLLCGNKRISRAALQLTFRGIEAAVGVGRSDELAAMFEGLLNDDLSSRLLSPTLASASTSTEMSICRLCSAAVALCYDSLAAVPTVVLQLLSSIAVHVQRSTLLNPPGTSAYLSIPNWNNGKRVGGGGGVFGASGALSSAAGGGGGGSDDGHGRGHGHSHSHGHSHGHGHSHSHGSGRRSSDTPKSAEPLDSDVDDADLDDDDNMSRDSAASTEESAGEDVRVPHAIPVFLEVRASSTPKPWQHMPCVVCVVGVR